MRFFTSGAPRPPKDPPSDTSPAHMPVHPPHPTHTAGDAREQRGTYIVVLDERVRPEVQEAQRHIALTIVACAPQWGHAILLTRDTEGNTHVSTPPHTTPTRHAEGGRGTGGCKGGCGGGRSMAEGDGHA